MSKIVCRINAIYINFFTNLLSARPSLPMVGPRTLKIWTTNSGLQMIARAIREPGKLVFRVPYQSWSLHVKVEIMRLGFELVGSFTSGIWSTVGFGKSMPPRIWTRSSKSWSRRGIGDWNQRKFATGEWAFEGFGLVWFTWKSTWIFHSANLDLWISRRHGCETRRLWRAGGK